MRDKLDYDALLKVHQLIEAQPEYFYMYDTTRPMRALDRDVGPQGEHLCGSAACIAGWLQASRRGFGVGDEFIFRVSLEEEAGLVASSWEEADCLADLFDFCITQDFPARAVLKWILSEGEERASTRLCSLKPLLAEDLIGVVCPEEADSFDDYYEQVLPILNNCLEEACE